MFSNWQKEKAANALVDEARALAERLETAKPSALESYAAYAHFWAVVYASDDVDLHSLVDWKPAALARFISATQTKIAALRKQREYASSDGLAIWLHTARAVSRPGIAAPVREIWDHLSTIGVNADSMADDLLQDAGLPTGQSRRIPKGFSDG